MMKIALLVGLMLSLLVSAGAMAAPMLEQDEPQIADPSWAGSIREQLDNDRYDEALSSLQKLQAKYGKTFQYHALIAEAYEGKSIDSDAEKDEIRWLKKARESYLVAESLAPAKEKPTVRKIRELVEADLKDLGVKIPSAGQKAAPSKPPAKATKKAFNGVATFATSAQA